MSYFNIEVIVVAQGQRFMVVNKLNPKAKPEDKVSLLITIILSC